MHRGIDELMRNVVGPRRVGCCDGCNQPIYWGEDALYWSDGAEGSKRTHDKTECIKLALKAEEYVAGEDEG